jgi:hypothetical protein
VNREQIIERLRTWAARAQYEAQYADTRDDILNWQGQAQVLSSIATYLAGQGAELSYSAIWKQVVTDRGRALAEWERNQEGPEAMMYAGIVAGYDVALTILSDVAGMTFLERPLRYG